MFGLEKNRFSANVVIFVNVRSPAPSRACCKPAEHIQSLEQIGILLKVIILSLINISIITIIIIKIIVGIHGRLDQFRGCHAYMGK